MPKVVILGGGVGGTAVANGLARQKRDLEIVVVDGHGDHLFQPGNLHVPFRGETVPLSRDVKDLVRPGVKVVVEKVVAIDRALQKIRFESGGTLDYDALVIATGSRLAHDRVPGAREVAHNFHCPRGAKRLREALAEFRGGRVVVGAASLPYKCPPSPIEFAFLLDEWLREKGLRETSPITFVYPLPEVFPYDAVARMVRPMMEERGIEIRTSFANPSVDPEKNVLTSIGGSLPFDLLVLVPPHTAMPFLASTGWTDDDGWVKTNPSTLRVADRIYAIGDTTNLPRPKSGSAALFSRDTLVDNLLAELDGEEPRARYDGRVACFLETGRGRASLLDFDYSAPPTPKRPSRLTFWKKKFVHRFYFSHIRRA